MSRSARATLLMLALLWQSLVWLTPGGHAQLSTDLSNAWVHAQAGSHHAGHGHHDHAVSDRQSDPSLHLDVHNADGAHHHHETAQPLGLAPKGESLGFDRPPSTQGADQAPPIVSVFLQGPLRPPQPQAA